MRPLITTLLVLALCVSGFQWYRVHARAAHEAVKLVVPPPPAPAHVSLEERAAAARGTKLPPEMPRSIPRPVSQLEPAVERIDSTPSEPRYRCDGRVHCSQMHSCDEAEWFLQNCSGMKMDGDGDGLPCERGPC